MKPLATSKQVMTWLCMCPADESTNKTRTMYYAAFTITVGTLCFGGLLASVAFIWKYLSSDFEESLYGVFQAAGDISDLIVIVIAFIIRHQTAAIFTKLEDIYTANEKDPSFKYFMEVNDRSEWLWNIFYKLAMKGALIMVAVSIVASLIYCWLVLDHFDVDHFYRVFKFVLPWDQTTPLGYFCEVAFSLVSGEIYLIINAAVLILFISICWHHQAFYEKFHLSIIQLDQPKNKQNARNANEMLCELIRFHVTARDWFFESAEVYSPFILIQLTCNVVFMSAIVFQLDLQLKHIEFEFLFLLFAFCNAVCNLFVYCYFGAVATECYERMAECLYESNWHEKSLDLQKNILLMIRNMQVSVVYHGFGIAVLNLLTFIKFIRAVVTYFMMFKALTIK